MYSYEHFLLINTEKQMIYVILIVSLLIVSILLSKLYYTDEDGIRWVNDGTIPLADGAREIINSERQEYLNSSYLMKVWIDFTFLPTLVLYLIFIAIFYLFCLIFRK